MSLDRLCRIGVPLVLLLVILGVLVASFDYGSSERALPVLVAGATIVLLVLELLVQARTRAGRRIETLLAGKSMLPEPERAPLGKALVHALVWPGALTVLVVVTGLLPAVFIYVGASLRLAGLKPWTQSVAIAMTVTAVSWLLFEWAMSYELYRGMLWGR